MQLKIIIIIEVSAIKHNKILNEVLSCKSGFLMWSHDNLKIEDYYAIKADPVMRKSQFYE